MAIYHCSLRTFSRSQGDSAVAAAAYRAGAKLCDKRTGRIHRYENRKGVKAAFIVAPHGVPEKFLTRAFLWNAAEIAETRKNSRVAREVILALPHELSDKARAELARDMGLYLMERYRVAVDVAIHSPAVGDGHDERNHHAHLLFTTRELTEDGFGKKTRILDDKQQGPAEIELIREVWETLANDALEGAGFPDAKIDRRTLEAQGVDRIPQTHEGKASRNAAAAQSLLAKDFREAEREDDDEESGEGEASGGKGSSSGGSSSCGQGANLQSKIREDSAGRSIDYPALDQQKTRSSFNAEIKTLNEKRAAFGDKPLIEQIAQLDRLMERLDRRVEKLQQLESRTGLKAAIRQSITSAVKLAASLLINRKEARTAIKLTAEEKQARKERQIIRYGRSYREGIHSQIKEMKQNMALVEARKEDFRRYKCFVDSIDRDLAKHSPSITGRFKEQNPPPARRVTEIEVNLKLRLRAEMVRSHIPEQYRAPSPFKGDRKTLTNSIAVNQILQSKAESIKINKTPPPKPQAQAAIREAAPPVRAAFADKAQARPTPKAQPEYKQTMSVRIKAIEQAIAQRQAERRGTSSPASRKSWLIPASEKMQPLQRSIEAALASQKQAMPQQRPGNSETQSAFFKAQDRQRKTATYSQVREKVRVEAESKRAKVPPHYRAESYEQKATTPEQSGKTVTIFSKAASAENEPQTSRSKMSARFNEKSGVNEASRSKLDSRHKEKPEVDI